MKIVINRCYGGYKLNPKFKKKAEQKEVGYEDEVKRTDPELIAEIENGKYENAPFSKLCVVKIPDNHTDYEIIENDGYERLIYVVNGLIYWA